MPTGADILLARMGKSRQDFAKQSNLGKLFRREGVPHSQELERILALPRRQWQAEDPAAVAGLASSLQELFGVPGGAMPLWPVQVVGVAELHDYGGLFGPIKVGGGKTLLTFLAPSVVEAERPLLLIPAKLRGKTVREFAALESHWHPPRGLEIMTYELLGRDRGGHELERICPDLIIADEAHKLKNLRAGCTRKVRRHLQAYPETRFVALSGTITSRSLREYHHLITWCLPRCMPLPRQWGELQDWADCLDEKVDELRRLAPGALLQLCTDAELDEARAGQVAPITAARRAYRRRLVETPGVVATDEGALGCSLQIEELRIETSDAAHDAFMHLRLEWETPDGHPICEAMEIWRHAREIACGFYYRWWNGKDYLQCLKQTSSAEHIVDAIRTVYGPVSGHIVERILKNCVPQTVPDIALEKAVETLLPGVATNSHGICKHDTGSLLRNTRPYTINMLADATCAGAKQIQENVAKTEALLSQLITITQRGGSEVCCASFATERLEIWETLLRLSPGLLHMFAASLPAAKAPPEWLKARREWAAFVRETLKHTRRALDTEFQVAAACARGELDAEAYDAWVTIRDSFKPNTVPVWIDDAMLEAAAAWLAVEGEPPGLCWVEHRAFGHRLSERTGLPYFANEGRDAEGRFVEDHEGPAILSIASNNEGRNLQHKWSRNLVVSAPPKGAVWEQLLGRTHREGQQADEVTCTVALACSEQWAAFQQSVADAHYIQDTMGTPQKLCFADVCMPDPSEVNARGLEDPAWWAE